MRICLINPPRIHPKSWGKPSVFQPLDIAYVAAVLEKKHKVHVIDAPTEGWRNLEQVDETRYRVGLTNKEIAEKVKRWSPDVVGITIPFSGWWKSAYEVVSVVKGVDKDIITVLSGLHPSSRPEQSLTCSNADFVVLGEPEYSMLELVEALEQGTIAGFKKVRESALSKMGKRLSPLQDL